MFLFGGTDRIPEADTPLSPPFVIEQMRREEKGNGSFTPAAQLVLSAAFRTSGLIRVLPDAEARSLLALLSFLTANGRIEANSAQVGTVLGISESKAAARLQRLCGVEWQGKPVVLERTHENGLNGFAPSHHIVGTANQVAPVAGSPRAWQPYRPSAPVSLAGRESVIEQSRAAYGRPRAEVEKEVAEQLGYLSKNAPEATSPIAARLMEIGVGWEQASALVAAHPESEITAQIEWLPLRAAKNPARFIVAAIQNRYEPPARIRLERAIAAELASGEPEVGDVAPSGTPSVGETTELRLPKAEENAPDYE